MLWQGDGRPIQCKISESEWRERSTHREEEYDERYAFVLNMKTANNKDKAIMWLKNTDFV